MTKVLVTGGLGFVGRNLCSCLVANGYSVKVLDKHSLNSTKTLSFISVTRSDILNTQDVAKAMRETDCVVHLAAQPGIEKCSQQPVESLEVNVSGTLNLLKEAANQGIRQFILASSVGAVLGIQSQPTNETQVPSPLTIYGWSKLMSERLAGEYADRMAVAILRFTNIYGKHSQHKSSIVTKLLLRQIDSTFKVYGDGEQTRDLVYVGDVSRAILLCLEKNISGLYHIGLGKGIRLLDLISLVEKVTGRAIPVEFTDARLGDIKDNYTNLAKARDELGYEPQVSIKEGIERTWQWAKGLLEKPHRGRVETERRFKVMRNMLGDM